MHGKAQRESTLHSVVLDCKLVSLHNTCQSLPAVCYISGAGKLTYCAFFDKSTNFDTEVEQYIMKKIWGWSHHRTAPWRPWRPFSKMAASRHITDTKK